MTRFWARYRFIILICAAAFLLRLAYRLASGPEEFWSNSYIFFYQIAQNLVAGKGLSYSSSFLWSMRVPPVYPLFLAPAVLLGGNYLYIVVPQALVGAGTALCAFLIGRELFSPRAGLIAATLTAIYPYYVVHDTGIEESSLLAFCMALSIWLLLRARRAASPRFWLASGAMLSISILVRIAATPFALTAVAWVWLFGEGSAGLRLARSLTVLACVALTAAVWMQGNGDPAGRPSGFVFWAAHNPQTFSHYPVGSMDASADAAIAALSPADQVTLRSFSQDPAARNAWYVARARAYLRTQSLGEKLHEASRKVVAGFSWVLNPEKPGARQWAYFLSYTPVLFLGLAGMVLTWRDWRRQSLIYLQFLIFIAVTAVLWAHTGHRAPLDVYLMIFAGAALDRLWSVLRPPENAVPERPDR